MNDNLDDSRILWETIVWIDLIDLLPANPDQPVPLHPPADLNHFVQHNGVHQDQEQV